MAIWAATVETVVQGHGALSGPQGLDWLPCEEGKREFWKAGCGLLGVEVVAGDEWQLGCQPGAQ